MVLIFELIVIVEVLDNVDSIGSVGSVGSEVSVVSLGEESGYSEFEGVFFGRR